MGNMYGELFGSGAPMLNRAQRRTRAKHERAAQKKGQRAYEATLARKAAIERERDAEAGFIRDEIIDFTKKESK